MPIGFYKLVRQAAGSGRFARVRLRLEPPPIQHDVIVAQIKREHAANAWILAAIDGANDAIGSLDAADQFAVAEIVELLGTDCDTTEQDAWCAGYLAALDAMSITDAQPVFDRENRVWKIVRGETS